MEIKQNQSYYPHRISTTFSSALYRCLPAAIFLGVIFWFGKMDVYHRHFFDQGSIVLFYNFFRFLFVLLISWIIYATGYLFLLTVTSIGSFNQLTYIERYVLGFGTGVGIWHLSMLLLGIFNLYYPSVMVIICLAILLMSSRHLENSLRTVGRQIYQANQQSFSSRLQLFSHLSIIFIMMWVLLVRGLYPSGGHDYFTHYFYYYMTVIKQHGLAPNDVWYHYYYSKGAGLHFLGILLTDPLSPSLMVFVCVATASLALYSLTRRLSPQTLWPLFCASIYLFYNLFSIVDSSGGEFQKIHEEVSALVVLAIWSVSMTHFQKNSGKQAVYICLASTLISAAILTQAISIFFIAFLGIKIIQAVFNKNKADAKALPLVSMALFITTCGIFLLNYVVTGLVTDQLIDQMWRFANIEKLDQWGVLPNIMQVAWIRHNLGYLVTPWAFTDVYQQLISYTRANFLSIALMSMVFPLFFYMFLIVNILKSQFTLKHLIYLLLSFSVVILLFFIGMNSSLAVIKQFISLLEIGKHKFFYSILFITALYFTPRLITQLRAKHKIQTDSIRFCAIQNHIFHDLITIFITFIALSVIFGHTPQAGSFLRFSTFFVPLILVVCSASWSWLININSSSRLSNHFSRQIMPIILIVSVLMSWPNWFTNAKTISTSPAIFLSSKISLAEAYSKQLLGFPFGGIHPGTWQAMQQVPRGERVWSTTVVSYCMAPECQVESFISFKFSSRMNEILNGTPEIAKNILQQEGLNYFLFLSEYPLCDFLPYSPLFNTENIKKHFTIKWTDGKTYLLTWKNPSDHPVTDAFVKAYANRLGEKEDPAFKYRQSLVYLNQFMTKIKNQGAHLSPIKFPWKEPNNLLVSAKH